MPIRARSLAILLAGLVLIGTSSAREIRDDLPDAPVAANSAVFETLQESATAGGDGSTQRGRAAEQVREEEHQRILGIVPNFSTSYRSDAVSLTSGQKLKLAFRSAVDPATFATGFVVAGFHEANGEDFGFGWGPAGYFKHAGATYLDAFDGTMIGAGILPSLLRQDPRYFRLGHGSTAHRLFYAAAAAVICRHDNSRRWEPNYSNVGGNLIAGALSRLYYPSQENGAGDAITNALTVTLEGTISTVFEEFWPDISRKLFHADPTHGLDANARTTQPESTTEKQPIDQRPK